MDATSQATKASSISVDNLENTIEVLQSSLPKLYVARLKIKKHRLDQIIDLIQELTAELETQLHQRLLAPS